jgi:hypothetical protein
MDELWKVNNMPFVVIHLSQKKKDKKKKDKKKGDKKKDEKEAAEDGEKEESDDDDKNKVIYNPSIEDCKKHVLQSMDNVINSTNSVNCLESDLMPFLQKQASPNFKIS